MSKLSKYCYRQKTKARHILEKAAQKEIDDFCHMPDIFYEEDDENYDYPEYDNDNYLDDDDYYNEDPLEYYDDLDLYWENYDNAYFLQYGVWRTACVYELSKENRELKSKIQSLEKFIKTELLPPPDRGVDNRLA